MATAPPCKKSKAATAASVPRRATAHECGSYVPNDEHTLAQQLKTEGVAVVPCLQKHLLPDIRAEFDATLKSFPEFREGATAFSMGGFSALGNPASFHNPLVRRIREWCMHACVTHLWREYIREYKPTFKLEQCVDRMMLRPAGVSPSKESWHRDEAINSGPADETFGGWINLDDQPQFFNCVLGTHVVANRRGGFATIKSEVEKARYAATCQSIAVPPGHILVFYEHIIHEVRAKKFNYPLYRVFTGWRITDQDQPLIPPTTDALRSLFNDQAVMPLKSGQMPPMYAALHWVNWKQKIVDFSTNLIDVCKEIRRPASGLHQHEVFRIVHHDMRSLRSYGLPMYAAYRSTEINMHIPHRSWTVLQPGETSTEEKIYLA
jgi:hypothetical protein